MYKCYKNEWLCDMDNLLLEFQHQAQVYAVCLHLPPEKTVNCERCYKTTIRCLSAITQPKSTI